MLIFAEAWRQLDSDLLYTYLLYLLLLWLLFLAILYQHRLSKP